MKLEWKKKFVNYIKEPKSVSVSLTFLSKSNNQVKLNDARDQTTNFLCWRKIIDRKQLVVWDIELSRF